MTQKKEKAPSRLADKFVVRMPDGLREQVEEQAKASFTSMNTFCLQAIAEKLDRDCKMQLLLSLLVEKAGQQQG